MVALPAKNTKKRPKQGITSSAWCDILSGVECLGSGLFVIAWHKRGVNGKGINLGMIISLR
jgi:hypothetical protein